MPRYDVYAVGGGLLVDVQTDYLDVLRTRIVIPLLPLADSPIPARRLNPVFVLGARPFALQTHLMSAIATKELGRPVDNLDHHHDDIAGAIGLIFNGF